MSRVKMLLKDKEILPYDHPGLQIIHCPLCGELMTFLQYKEPGDKLPFVMMSASLFKYPIACIECKKFFFFERSPIQLKEIPKPWGYRFKKVKHLKWEEQYTKETEN